MKPGFQTQQLQPLDSTIRKLIIDQVEYAIVNELSRGEVSTIARDALKATKELREEINALKAENANLKAQLKTNEDISAQRDATYKAKIEELQNQFLEELEAQVSHIFTQINEQKTESEVKVRELQKELNTLKLTQIPASDSTHTNLRPMSTEEEEEEKSNAPEHLKQGPKCNEKVNHFLQQSYFDKEKGDTDDMRPSVEAQLKKFYRNLSSNDFRDKKAETKDKAKEIFNILVERGKIDSEAMSGYDSETFDAIALDVMGENQTPHTHMSGLE